MDNYNYDTDKVISDPTLGYGDYVWCGRIWKDLDTQQSNMRVYHERYGFGNVVKHKGARATIQFSESSPFLDGWNHDIGLIPIDQVMSVRYGFLMESKKSLTTAKELNDEGLVELLELVEKALEIEKGRLPGGGREYISKERSK